MTLSLPSRPPLLATAALALALGLHGCGERPPGTTPGTPSAQGPAPLEIDFGVVPHDESRETTIVIPVPEAGGPYTPLGLQRSCTCVSHEFVVRAPDGKERRVAGDGRPDPIGAIQAGETLELRLSLDTREKEAADLEPEWSPAQVILQGPSPSFTRRYVPLRFRFGIRSPLQLTPTAHLALGDLPRPIRYEQSIEIHRRGRQVKLGTPEVLEITPDGMLHRPGDVEVQLDADREPALLSVAIKPSDSRPDGPLQCSIRIPTDLEGGYTLRIPLSGAVVGAIEVEPPGVFSFGRIDMEQPREMRLRIIDHDLARSADFLVLSIRSDEGKDLSDQFSVHVEPIEGRPRDRIVALRYLGRSEGRSFRGELQLGKTTADAPLVRLPLMGFSIR